MIIQGEAQPSPAGIRPPHASARFNPLAVVARHLGHHQPLRDWQVPAALQSQTEVRQARAAATGAVGQRDIVDAHIGGDQCRDPDGVVGGRDYPTSQAIRREFLDEAF